MNEKTKKILLVFTIILFGGFGIYLTFISGNMNQFDSQTRAYKIEVVERTGSDDTTYAPVYYYRVKGEIYTCESQISGSNYPNLKKNIVYYDSKNPEKCLTQYEKTSGRTFGIIMLALSILIAVLSIRKPSTVSNSSKSNVTIDKETQ